MKYVIKNCPCAVNDMFCKENRFFCYHPKLQVGSLCQDCTDCLLKRIVELCDSNASKILYEGKTLKFVEGNPLAKKILELLEIEEVDE